MNETFDLISILKTEEDVALYRNDIAYGDRTSRYFTREDIGILTLRELAISSDSLSVNAKHFVLKDSKVYLYESELDKFILLNHGHVDILKVAQDNHQVNAEILNSYYGQIDMLEDCIYERDVPRHFMDTWFDLKKNLLKIERYFNRYVLILNGYMKDQSSKGTIDISEGQSLLEKATVSLGQSTGLVSRLDTIHNYYNSVKNDKLNKNIYFLTLISGIFLPLNLIVGFFGMNTENLFFKDHPQGTLFVVYILGGVIFTLTIGFRIAHFIDKKILRRSLGQYKVYQAVFKNVEKIEKVFKVNS
jgi:magnesium transporter